MPKFKKLYQPQTLDELVVANDDLMNDFESYASGNLNDDLLFYGPPGSGKSIAAKIIAGERRNCKCSSVESYAGSQIKKDELQNILQTAANFQRMQGSSNPTIIFDEIDHLSKNDQYYLRDWMDKNPDLTIIGTTNNEHILDAPLKDRMECIQIPYPASNRWHKRASEIVQAEGKNLSQTGIQKLLKDTDGSARSVLAQLEKFCRMES